MDLISTIKAKTSVLPKTFQMIDGLKPGTFVPDGTTCFDEDEIRQLGAILQRLIYAPSQIRKKLQDYGVNIIPCNFYSEIPSIDEIYDSFEHQSDLNYDRIFDADKIRITLREMMEFVDEFQVQIDAVSDTEFFWGNSQFSYSDALSYYCMIRLKKPKCIVEIGSGYSTLVATMAVKKNGYGRIICIEPFPRDFMEKLDVELVRKKLQHIDIDFFNQALSTDGDFLFIDSTHTVKHGSDCLKIYLSIIPLLKQNIYIHAHDIFLPRPFALEQMRDIQIYWTEQYLLYAYLLENNRASVIFGSSFCYMRMQEELEKFMAGKYGAGGGSLWFHQLKAADL